MPERILEQIVDVPVPQFMEGTTVPVPLQDETDEVIQLIPAERLSECIVEKIVDAPGPQFQEQTEEVVKITPTEHLVKTAAPHVAAKTLDVIKGHAHGAQFRAHRGAESCAVHQSGARSSATDTASTRCTILRMRA